MRGMLLVALVALLGAAPAPAEVLPDPSARLLDDGSSWEDWSLTIQLESGHRVFAHFMITNQGPGSRNAIVLGHLVAPDGKAHFFKNGRTQSRWELSDDRRGLDVGSSHLELRDPLRLRIAKSGVKIDLRMRAQAGLRLPPDVLPADYHVDLLAAAAPTEGTIWVPGMEAALTTRGVAGVVHSWSARSEKKLIDRRLDTFAAPGGVAFYALRLDTPDGRRGWVGAVGPSGQLFGTSVTSALEGRARLDEKPKYGLPRQETLTGPGATGRIELRRQLLEHDPSGVIPLALRWFLGGDLPYRVWAESGLDVTLSPGSETDSLHVRGLGVTVGTFLNPVD